MVYLRPTARQTGKVATVVFRAENKRIVAVCAVINKFFNTRRTRKMAAFIILSQFQRIGTAQTFVGLKSEAGFAGPMTADAVFCGY